MVSKESFYDLLAANQDDTLVKQDNTCLITGEILVHPIIKLHCGHRFNYNSMFNEVTCQKGKGTTVNGTMKLNKSQMMCPYCRTVENHLLPYVNISDTDIPTPYIQGVNAPSKFALLNNKCCVFIKTGKNNGKQCMKKCFETRCTYHINKELNSCEIVTCSAIIKTGVKKGQFCQSQAKLNGKCLRHKTS